MPDPLEARDWLFYPNRESDLPDSMRLIRDRMMDRHQEGDLDAVEEAVEHLLTGRERLRGKGAINEATLEAGLGCYVLGQYERALALLDRAAAGFQPQDHFVAVALWMKGCVLAGLPVGKEEAFQAWSVALDLFTRRQEMVLGEAHEQWYASRVQTVREALLALQENPLPTEGAEPLQGENGWVTEFPEVSAPETQERTNGPQLQLFRVVEEVPAGGFGPVGYQPFTIGEVRVRQVWIDDQPHRMINLQNPGNIIFLRSSQYVVVRVTGDSMNKPDPKTRRAGIDRGDYVLLRLQDTAEHGDIIAAEIDGVDDRATLKQLRIVEAGRRVVLMPQSTNPEHAPMEFDALNAGFRVRGVALVVFKPLG
jgi:hypothetical protein